MHAEHRVDFFIAGVQKGGTTALTRTLRDHPDIQMSRRKEAHFFDNEQVDWSSPDYSALHDLFDWSEPKVRGEATPIYTYWPEALERIARYNPAAKLVIILRNPVYRAHSHWRMSVKRGLDQLPFSEAIREGRHRAASGLGRRRHSYVERGFYAPQIARSMALFPAQVHFLTADRLWSHPERSVAEICAFLGIEPIIPDVAGQYIVPFDTSEMAPISEEDLHYLNQLYLPDLDDTARLTGLDLTEWLAAGYREPMMPAIDPPTTR